MDKAVGLFGPLGWFICVIRHLPSGAILSYPVLSQCIGVLKHIALALVHAIADQKMDQASRGEPN